MTSQQTEDKTTGCSRSCGSYFGWKRIMETILSSEATANVMMSSQAGSGRGRKTFTCKENINNLTVKRINADKSGPQKVCLSLCKFS